MIVFSWCCWKSGRMDHWLWNKNTVFVFVWNASRGICTRCLYVLHWRFFCKEYGLFIQLYACKWVIIQSFMLEVRWFLFLSFTWQSYVSAHPRTVLLDPLPAMTQLLDRFASYRIMSKLQSSLRGEMQLQSVYCSSLLLEGINACLSYYILFNRLVHLQSSLPRGPQCQWPVIHSAGCDEPRHKLSSQSVHSLSICVLLVLYGFHSYISTS